MNKKASANPHDALPGHPIKIASQRSGLTTHAIRVWEKRYRAVTPIRTKTNRRLYTQADIERLSLLKIATQNGHSIGQIANLSDHQLHDLIAQDETSLGKPNLIPVTHGFQSYIETGINATKQLDSKALQAILVKASVELSQPILIEKVIVPIMYHIGDLWQQGHLRISHEHMAYAVIRTFLENLKTSYTVSPTAPRMVVATPTGQLHELGALIVSTIAAAEGWQVTYLGTSLPSEEIASAILQNEAQAVALSLIYPGDDPNLNVQLTNLRRSLSPTFPILIGGRAAPSYRSIIQSIDANEVTDINDLRNHFNRLRSI